MKRTSPQSPAAARHRPAHVDRPGGIGKTRLAAQVAAEALDEFADGAYFVGLAPIRDPELVVPTIGKALGVAMDGGRPPLETLKEHLRGRAAAVAARQSRASR